MVTLQESAVETQEVVESRAEKKTAVRKIAIVGTAPSSVLLAPYDDPSWEIWSMGRNSNIITQAVLSINNVLSLPHGHEERIIKGRPRRFTKWYEIHTKQVLQACNAWDICSPFFNQIGSKLTLGSPIEELPNAQILDKERLFKAFPKKYFQSSIDYMLAEAILEQPSELGIWGVDMLTDGEYGFQKPSAEYYLGLAEGRGIKTYVPEASALLRCDRLYGLEHQGLSREILLMENELKGATEAAEANKIKAIIHEAEVRGRSMMLADISRRWG